MPRDFHNYPKWKYKEGESARLVQTHNEEVDLGDTWYDKPDGTNHTIDLAAAATSAAPPGYEPKEYPKWRYAPQFPGGRIVNSEDEEAALPDVDWFDKPDFTDHGQDSTDLSSAVRTNADANTPPFDALSGERTVLAPVPEMQQGTARQMASNETDEGRKGLNEDTADAQRDAQNDAGKVVGTPHNNFDQATGTNAGDKVPSGENANDAVGRVTTSGEQTKTTAQETTGGAPKAGTAAKKKAKPADDLL